MFPRTWTQDRLRVELEHAFQNGRLSEEGERKGVGTTRSGVEVEWFFDKKGNISTVYPVRGQ